MTDHPGVQQIAYDESGMIRVIGNNIGLGVLSTEVLSQTELTEFTELLSLLSHPHPLGHGHCPPSCTLPGLLPQMPNPNNQAHCLAPRKSHRKDTAILARNLGLREIDLPLFTGRGP